MSRRWQLNLFRRHGHYLGDEIYVTKSYSPLFVKNRPHFHSLALQRLLTNCKYIRVRSKYQHYIFMLAMRLSIDLRHWIESNPILAAALKLTRALHHLRARWTWRGCASTTYIRGPPKSLWLQWRSIREGQASRMHPRVFWPYWSGHSDLLSKLFRVSQG